MGTKGLILNFCLSIVFQLQEVTADLMEENTTSNQAGEMLEAESAARMRIEKELKDLQVIFTPPQFFFLLESMHE